MKSKVTIAIPTYNRANFLKEAIESCLKQTFRDFELLVVDNASDDKTEDVVRSFKDNRISYHRNDKNLGIIGNWNKSIDLAKGELLMILGDDDKLHNNFL